MDPGHATALPDRTPVDDDASNNAQSKDTQQPENIALLSGEYCGDVLKHLFCLLRGGELLSQPQVVVCIQKAEDVRAASTTPSRRIRRT